jgi:hypothetical protein|eukprot:COSAG01_NODE_11298_length_1964_cov_1.673995_2_plen_60_part_00
MFSAAYFMPNALPMSTTAALPEEYRAMLPGAPASCSRWRAAAKLEVTTQQPPPFFWKWG